MGAVFWGMWSLPRGSDPRTHRQKFQNKMDGLTAAIEPLLIGAIAGFVLLLALGIFMLMWDMAGVVKR